VCCYGVHLYLHVEIPFLRFEQPFLARFSESDLSLRVKAVIGTRTFLFGKEMSKRASVSDRIGDSVAICRIVVIALNSSQSKLDAGLWAGMPLALQEGR